jgi:hypothetical protein
MGIPMSDEEEKEFKKRRRKIKRQVKNFNK